MPKQANSLEQILIYFIQDVSEQFSDLNCLNYLYLKKFVKRFVRTNKEANGFVL